MTQIFFPPNLDNKCQTLYCYVNKFSKVVIAKIHGIKDRQCERVIFPEEKFLFWANDNCEIEIIQQTNIGIIQNVLSCSQLQVITE